MGLIEAKVSLVVKYFQTNTHFIKASSEKKELVQ
jgi:hypothetical protein